MADSNQSKRTRSVLACLPLAVILLFSLLPLSVKSANQLIQVEGTESAGNIVCIPLSALDYDEAYSGTWAYSIRHSETEEYPGFNEGTPGAGGDGTGGAHMSCTDSYTIDLDTVTGSQNGYWHFSVRRGDSNPDIVYATFLYEDGETTPIIPTVIPDPSQANTQYIQIISPYFNEMVDNSHDLEVDIQNPQFGGDFPINVEFVIRDYLTNQIEYGESIVLSTSTVDITYMDTASTTDGSKYFTVTMQSTSQNYPSAQGFYNVNVNTYLENTGMETPNSPSTGLSTIDCTTFDFGCQIQRAFAFLFIPSQTTVTVLLDIENQLSTKIPFKYFYGTVEMWGELSTGTTTLQALPVTYWEGETPLDVFATSTVNTFVPSTVINIFKALATAMIWLLVLQHFWMMRKRVFNTEA